MSTEKPPGGTPPLPSKVPLRPRLNSSGLWLLLILGVVLTLLWMNNDTPPRDEIKYSFFRDQLDHDNIKEVEFLDREQVVGKFREPPKVAETKPGAAKGSEQVIEKQLKPDFLVNLTPLVGEDLDKDMRAKGVLVQRPARPPTAPVCC